MSDIDKELQQLLQRMDIAAPQAERHLWLADVLQWIRGDQKNVQDAVRRVRHILAWVQEHPLWLSEWKAWWQVFISHVDATPLLADYGFAPRAAFISELGNRLRRKWLPATPETNDLSQLFHLLFPYAFDAQWIRAISPSHMASVEELLFNVSPAAVPAPTCSEEEERAESEHPLLRTTSSAWSQPQQSYWQQALTEAVVCCVNQVAAIGFMADIRTRMERDAATQNAFHNVHFCLDDWLRKVTVQGMEHPDSLAASETLRSQLGLCRQAAATVYGHLDEQGISVDIVFQLRQLRDRIQRVNDLLDCLYSQQPAHSTARLVARLILIGKERRSVRNLISTSTHMTATKVAERSAETGENYITRNRREWRHMLGRALGGGFAMGFAVWFKFLIGGLALSLFWNGFVSGLNYAGIFVLVQLLHWTIATKQPAMTAPAMAAKLKAMDQPNAVDSFVDEVAHLIRSQVVAIVGNLLTVAPTAWLISWILERTTGAPMMAVTYAEYTLSSFNLLGPTALFAAATGVMLFTSSIIAGWAENWFVFYRLDSGLRYHRGWRRWLGVQRAARFANWIRHNISGLAANISLGMMLGLVPSVFTFFGIPLEVRHVTLAAGQLAVAAHTMGLEVLQQPLFWWALAGVAVVGPINVAVSFLLAFRTAMTAQNVMKVDRQRIYSALRHRLRYAPWMFIFPPKALRKP